MDYTAFSMKQILGQMDDIMSIIQAVLGGIGGVALLIASIGIINTMTMAIYERTKEIGIMKVVGATLKNIRNIFLFESSIIGFFGGLFGVGLSVLMVMIANLILGSVVSASGSGGISGAVLSMPAWLAIGGALFSAFVGLASGLYPAVKASRLSALTAIRTE
jgi:putative ABC transport system permease protein